MEPSASSARNLPWTDGMREEHGEGFQPGLSLRTTPPAPLPERETIHPTPWSAGPPLTHSLYALKTAVPGGSAVRSQSVAEGYEGTGPIRHVQLLRRLLEERVNAMSGPLTVGQRRPLWTACLLVLLAASLIYTYAGTVARETYRQTWLPENSVPFTLDGMAFMRVAYPGDYAGIRWLNAHVHGAQVVAEAGGTYYDWRSRVSMFTGLPTIINGIHEGEQRYADQIDPTALCNNTRDSETCQQQTHSRADDLTALYDSPSVDDAWRVIREYGVRYIFVGFSERQCAKEQCYSKQGLRKFDRMVGRGLIVAFRQPGVRIYEVVRT